MKKGSRKNIVDSTNPATGSAITDAQFITYVRSGIKAEIARHEDEIEQLKLQLVSLGATAPTAETAPRKRQAKGKGTRPWSPARKKAFAEKAAERKQRRAQLKANTITQDVAPKVEPVVTDARELAGSIL